MKQLISDETKFKKLAQNPTKSREDSLLTYSRKLRKDGILDDATFQKILPSGSSTGVLYGLPKVALFALSFPLLTLTTTILYLISYAFLNLSPPTSLQ